MSTFLRPDAPLVGLLEGLNDKQALAVSTLEGPVMIVAGPGSGKTRVLTHRVAALLVRGVWASHILAVTFTNKAASEMRERILDLVGEEEARRLNVSTFHSFCVRLLRRYSSEAGLDAAFAICDSDDSRKVVKGVLQGLGIPTDEVKRYTGAISWAKNNRQGPRDVESDLHRLTQVYEAYQRELKRQNLVDFDDLLVLAMRLLQDRSDVLQAVQEKYQFVMVDEYQDTNRVQYEIVRLICKEHQNLCVVGDHDQSIYAWRGAFSEAISGFVEDFPKAVIITLDQNYRSSKNVVDASKVIISANPAAHRGDLWTNNPAGEEVRVVAAEDDRQEAEWIVSDITKNSGSCAVIVRTKAQTKAFEVALAQKGIPHVVVGTQRFYDRSEIKDALSWIRLALNPHDRGALERAVGAPKRGIGDTTLAQLFSVADREEISPLEVISDTELLGEFATRAIKPLISFAGDVREVLEAARRGPDVGLECAIGFGLRQSLSGEPERVENLSQLVSDAAVFSSYQGNRGVELTREFLESASLSASGELASEEAHGAKSVVSVITAHASKGREFDNVYVAGVEENLYPHRLVVDQERGVEEERRLLFVAASRARKRLCISWCARRMVFGKWEDTGPSSFIDRLSKTAVFNEISARRYHDTRTTNRFSRTAAKMPLAGGRAAPSTLATLNKQSLIAGTMVSHPTFGVGEVLDDAGDKEVRIRFSDKVRTLIIALAPLSLVK